MTYEILSNNVGGGNGSSNTDEEKVREIIGEEVRKVVGQKPIRNLSSPKEAREILEEHARKEWEVRSAAHTLENSAKKDLEMAAKVLYKDASPQDRVRHFFWEEVDAVERNARRQGKSEMRDKAIAVGAAVVYAAAAIGGAYLNYKKSKTLKGRLLAWLSK